MYALLAGFAVFGAPPATTVNLPVEGGYVVDDDDDTPDVTARVARVSFIRGEAKIKRADATDWEKVTLNLPVVEGDEIASEEGARVEIQFDNFQHLRLGENSLVKIATLKDGGIAVSISLGTMSVRIREFDKNRAFFEIDAPKTTIAVQKSGVYRIDAGKAGDDEIRAAVTEGGEARIYSDTAGFTLKNNRTARVFIDGLNAGEWEAAQASQFTDEFDTWALDRDAMIAKRLSDAYYNKYYDNDIYGADDLNGYGDWVYTSKYGYVWKPYASAINVYADWSPYRYGHWRWTPPYGWVWINDEPWGWATYHHGRWFYDAGYWYWSPYGYYRHSRSWWFPALVAVTIVNYNVCWYPLPYHCHYYNYNWHHHHHGGHHGPYPSVQTGGIKPIPIRVPPADTDPPTGGIKSPPVTHVPPSGVIAMSSATFGTTVKGGQTAPIKVANSVLSHSLSDLDPPQLPSNAALTGKITREIIREKPKAELMAAQVKVGAAIRQPGEPLDKELRTTKVFGGRDPVAPSSTGGVKTFNTGSPDTRPTGAVVRPPIVKSDTEPPVKHQPVYTPPSQSDGEPTVKPPRHEPPVRQPPVQYDPPVRHDPPVKQPTYTPPPTPPRSDPPVKSPPRSDPPVKSTPPPTKSDSGGSTKNASNGDR
jgi:hypothetical protein